MLAGLSYQLPDLLECESYMDVITWIKRVTNSQIGLVTPHQLMTGQKSCLPCYHFGQVGLCYSPSKEVDLRSEWRIFIGYGPTPNYLRAYLPLKRHMYSKRKFSPHDTYPAELGLVPRLRPQLPLRSHISDFLPVASGNSDLQTGAPPRASPAPIIGFSDDEGVPAQEGAGAGTLPSSQTGVLAPVPFPMSASLPHASTQASTAPLEPVFPHAEGVCSDPPLHAAAPQEGDSGGLMVDGESVVQPLPRPRDYAHSSSKPSKLPTERPRRSTAGNWKDGPAQDKAGSFQTMREKEQKFLAKIADAVITRDIPAEISVMKASLKQALRDSTRRNAILQSIGAEIDNLEAPGVLQPLRYKDIPKEHRADIIGVYMFHREKYKADGTFEKDKTRIVLLSNRRDPSTIGETHCPTVNPISVMTQLNLAAVERGLIAAYDIKGAFLLTPMQKGKRMFIKISGDVVQYWVERYPERKHVFLFILLSFLTVEINRSFLRLSF